MADTSLTASERLEKHLYEMCEDMDDAEFRELGGSSEHWHTELLPRLLAYHHEERSRRPIAKNKVLELRDTILDNLEAREDAMDQYQTIKLGEVLTDDQLERAREIVAEGGPRTRDLLIREVLDDMDPPDSVRVQRDEHDRVKMYGEFLPAYLAYVIIYIVNRTT